MLASWSRRCQRSLGQGGGLVAIVAGGASPYNRLSSGVRRERSMEFDCAECGRHIISIVPSGYEPLCGLCVYHPGWFRNSELRKVLDPEHDGREPGVDPAEEPEK